MRSSQVESVANPTTECSGPNPNGVKDNSLGRLAPGSVEITVGQALKGRQTDAAHEKMQFFETTAFDHVHIQLK
jgi:hypothetical protein